MTLLTAYHGRPDHRGADDELLLYTVAGKHLTVRPMPTLTPWWWR